MVFCLFACLCVWRRWMCGCVFVVCLRLRLCVCSVGFVLALGGAFTARSPATVRPSSVVRCASAWSFVLSCLAGWLVGWFVRGSFVRWFVRDSELSMPRGCFSISEVWHLGCSAGFVSPIVVCLCGAVAVNQGSGCSQPRPRCLGAVAAFGAHPPHPQTNRMARAAPPTFISRLADGLPGVLAQQLRDQGGAWSA